MVFYWMWIQDSSVTYLTTSNIDTINCNYLQ